MQISDICSFLETLAPPALQESYDNAGLQTGDPAAPCTGIVCCLDATGEVIDEAIEKGCNMVVAHHPVIFKGMKSLTGKNYVERTIIKAIRNNIAIYAIHTNLDNVLEGVNGRIAAMLQLQNVSIAVPKPGTLRKLYTFCPVDHAGAVRDALFSAGGGHIGKYSECSFNTTGQGTFKGAADTNPYAGQPGVRHEETETKIEIVFPAHRQHAIIKALHETHPYEEVAFDILELSNPNPLTGAGVVGELAEAVSEKDFLGTLTRIFEVPVVRHSALTGKSIKRVMVCGGAGSFLIPSALRAKADVLVTADMKYHEFFDAEGKILIADIGHYESEQFTIGLLQDILAEKFPTFAVLKTVVRTNPVHYFS